VPLAAIPWALATTLLVHHQADALLIHVPHIRSIQVSPGPVPRAGASSVPYPPGSGPRSWPAGVDLDQGKNVPTRDVILFRRCVFLSLDLDASRLRELATALRALRGRQLASIQGNQRYPLKKAPPSQMVHHLMDKLFTFLLIGLRCIVG